MKKSIETNKALCPVCGKAKETNTYSCGGCGFPLAFVTKFSDKESYDLWSEQVKNEKQKLTNKKRKNHRRG